MIYHIGYKIDAGGGEYALAPAYDLLDNRIARLYEALG